MGKLLVLPKIIGFNIPSPAIAKDTGYTVEFTYTVDPRSETPGHGSGSKLHAPVPRVTRNPGESDYDFRTRYLVATLHAIGELIKEREIAMNCYDDSIANRDLVMKLKGTHGEMQINV